MNLMSTKVTSDNNSKNLYTFKRLDNEGCNYTTWAICCHMVLVSLDLWSVTNPGADTSIHPTPIPSSPSPSSKPKSETTSDPVAEWDRKNDHALTQIFLSIDDTPLQIINGNSTVREAWQALADHYCGVGALDATILSGCLHRFLLDDTKPLEPQINEMREMHSQLATLGDVLTDAKFAIVISDALPSSYDTLKTLTIAMVTDVSTLASNTLIAQILREEKRKNNQNTASALLAKPGKTPEKPSNSKLPNPKSKKGKGCPRCTNLKCKWQISHTIDQCWVEGGGAKGQQLPKPEKSQSGNGSTSKDSGKKKDGKVDLLLAHEHIAIADHICSFSSNWVVDSSASSHISANHDWFSSYSLLNPPCPIFLGDKCILHAIGQGQIEIVIRNDSDDHHAIVKDVLHCPQIRTNLLSVPHLTKLGAKV